MGSPCTINNILFDYPPTPRVVSAAIYVIFDPLTNQFRRSTGLTKALVRPPTPTQRVPFRAPFPQKFGSPGVYR
jgi:hypothetical protein